MHITSLAPEIYHVRFRSQKPLTKTFVRFQEYFESPKFRHRFFSLGSFRHWYITHSPEGRRTGRFTFYQDWGGFNIPSHILQPFYKGRFNPLSREEEVFLQHFQDTHQRRFYVIGTYGNHTKSILQHEIAHALFYLNKDYRLQVLRLLHTIDHHKRQEINHFLANTQGYHHDVWLDETHAYVMTLLDELHDAGIDVKPLLPVQKDLCRLFKGYFNGSLR